MAQVPAPPRPSSADSSLPPKLPSMLFSMLPSAVRYRLPGLPSLRRSSSMYGLTTRPRIAGSSYQSSGPQSPDSTIAGTMLWSRPSVEGSLYFTEADMEYSEDEDIAQVGKRKSRHTVILDESRSGIGWKFANQGI
jgi:hypothetical protein